MRIAKFAMLAIGAIALLVLTPMPRAQAMTTTAPAGIETVAPNNALVQKAHYVCRRYRYKRHGRWYWRTRCYWTSSPPYYRPYHRPYQYHSPYPWYYR